MKARTVVEVILVALAATAFGVGARLLPPVPKVHVGDRTWTVSWAAPAEDALAGGAQVTNAFPDGRAHVQTLRELLPLSLGGQAVRVRFTNEYGDGALFFTHVTAAPAAPGGAIERSKMRTLKFGGELGAYIAEGHEATTDPIGMSVSAGEVLAVSFSVRGNSPTVTLHQFAGVTSYVTALGAGDHTTDAGGGAYRIDTTAVFWLATVEVLNPPGLAHAVVAFGDSLTDAYLLNDGQPTWPELLQARLPESPSSQIGLINAGITGNTVTDVGCTDCGEPMVSRVIRDVVDMPGAKEAIVLGGTNDISRGASANQIVHGLAEIAAILHAHGIRALAMTIPPRDQGSFGWVDATMNPVREAVNGWLRAQHDFDGLIDIDRLLASPLDPARLNAADDRGDGTHLSAAGRAAVAGAIPVSLIATF